MLKDICELQIIQAVYASVCACECAHAETKTVNCRSNRPAMQECACALVEIKSVFVMRKMDKK